MLMQPRPHFSKGLDASHFPDTTPTSTFFDNQPYLAPNNFVQGPFDFSGAFPNSSAAYSQQQQQQQQQQQMQAQDWNTMHSAGASQQPPRKRHRTSDRRFSNDMAHKKMNAASTSQPQPLQQTPQQQQHLPTPSQTPTQGFLDAPGFYNPSRTTQSAMSAALALGAAFDPSFGAADTDIPPYAHSAGQSVSSYGLDSPATPRTVSGEDGSLNNNGEAITDDASAVDLDDYLLFHSQDFSTVPKFDRPLPAAYGDELFFGPGAAAPSYAQMPADASLLSPYRNHTVNERLQAANQARSASPIDPTQRRPSPFRPESPYAAPITDFATASGVRQRQKAEADALAYQQHHAQRSAAVEQPTISPKDAVLEYHDDASDMAGMDAPLFPPATSAFARHTIPAFSFAPPSLPSEGSNSMQQFLPAEFQQSSQLSESTVPDFPAHLISMETSASASDADASRIPGSSQGSNQSSNVAATSAPIFVCNSPGCTQRFESPGKLTRHRRESHNGSLPASQTSNTWQQGQQQQPQPLTANTASSHAVHTQGSSQGTNQRLSSEGSSGAGSPGDESGGDSPVGSGMTSAALMQRNAQAGPHRCSRVNPSTGKPCNTVFSRPYDLTRHEDTIHNGHKKKVRCHLCIEEKTFSRSDALTRHMRVVHPEVDFPGKHRRRHVS